MFIRNLGAERIIAATMHDFESEYVPTGGVVEVPDAVGLSLCAPGEWEDAGPGESAKDRKAREKAEAEAAWAIEVAAATEKAGE